MYASSFLLTLISNRFSFEVVERVWDIFFLEGWKIILRIIVAMFKQFKGLCCNSLFYQIFVCSFSSDKILKLNCVEIVPYLNEQALLMEPQAVIKLALSVKLRTATITRLKEQYEKTMLSTQEQDYISKAREHRQKLLQLREERKKLDSLNFSPPVSRSSSASSLPMKKSNSSSSMTINANNGNEEVDVQENANVKAKILLEYEFNDRFLYD